MKSPSAPKKLMIAQWLESALGALAVFAFRRPWLTLLLLACVTGFAGYHARTLHLDADLSRLLPESAPSVKALGELEQRTGGSGAVTVILRSEDPAILEKAAQTLSQKLVALPEIRAVEDRLPVDFFGDRALWFLETADIDEIAQKIQARHQFEKRRKNPMFVDLEDEPEPDLDLSAIIERTTARYGQFRVTEQSLTADNVGDQLAGRFKSKDGKTVVLFAKPNKRATDLDFASQVIRSVTDAVQAELHAFPNVTAEISGRYAKRLEQQTALSHDLSTASWLAAAGLLFYLIFHFRRIGAAVQVLLPLCLSLCWTFGLTAVLFDGLNLLTGMVAAILLGLGLDHGIHLLGRFEAEWASGKLPVEAVQCAFGQTGRAVLAAGITTVAGFLGLACSDFRAFHEFGVVAALGCTVVVLAYVLTLPALCALVGRNRRALKPMPVSPLFTSLPRTAPAVFWLTALAALGAVCCAGDVRFESDFAVLEDRTLPATILDHEVNALLGYTQTPIAVLTHSQADEQRLSAQLRELQKTTPEIDFILSMADLAPEIDDAKKAAVERLKEVAQALPLRSLPEAEQSKVKALRKMADQPAFGRADLPSVLRERFQSHDADPLSPGNVLIFTNISQSDGVAVGALTEKLRGALGGEDAPIAGEALILADVLAEVKREAPSVLILTFILVLTVLWLVMGRGSSALLPLCTALCTVVASIGVSALRGDALNYINIVMIPVLFGVGVDGAVHLMMRFEQDGEVVALGESGRAVTGALVTTIMGFGPLCFASHPGLTSLGRLAVIGLTCNLILCILTVSAFLALRASNREAVHVGRGFFTSQSDWQAEPVATSPRWARMIATMGLAGFSPKAPGTVGALIALPLAYPLVLLAPWMRAVVLLVVTALSVYVVHCYLGRDLKRDPQEVVIDETIGCLIACAFLPFDFPWVLAAFALFRLFDIVKPWPIGWVDRKVHGGLGVMLDDVLAGLAAGALLWFCRFWL